MMREKEVETRMGSKWKLNPKYLPIKLHFFLYFGGTSSLWPFITVFAKQIGISEVGVGIIFGVAPIAGLIAKPLFGAIADKLNKRKTLFLFFILLNLTSYLCVAFLPTSEPERPVSIECNNGISYIRQCSSYNGHCNSSIVEEFKTETKSKKSNQPDESSSSDTHSNSIEQLHLKNNLTMEHCFVHCEITSVRTFAKFCNSIYQDRSNPPPLCDEIFKMQSSTEHSQSKSQLFATHFTEIPNGFDKGGGTTDSGEEDEDDDVAVLNIATKVHLKHIELSGECLFLPIDLVTFNDEKGIENLGLSCSEKVTLQKCFATCPKNPALNKHLEVIIEDSDIISSRNFWVYGSLVVLAWISMAVVTSIGDHLCFETLGDKPHLYGIQRQYGAIGWGIFSLIAGFLIDTSSQGKLLKDYSYCFYMVAGLLFLDLIVSYKWEIQEQIKPKNLRKDVFGLLTNLHIFIFIIGCILVGMCTGMLWNFLFWYIEELSIEMSAVECEHESWSKILMGLITAVQCFGGEWPFFYFSGWFIKKLGHIHCMTLILAAFGFRFVMYSLITNPWFALPFELLQGVTFGIFYASMASYASEIAPAGTGATVQGLFGGSFEGIGVGAGSLIGGLFYRRVGGRKAFRIFGVASIVFAFIHMVLMYFIDKKPYRVPIRATDPDDGQEMFSMSSAQDVSE